MAYKIMNTINYNDAILTESSEFSSIRKKNNKNNNKKNNKLK